VPLATVSGYVPVKSSASYSFALDGFDCATALVIKPAFVPVHQYITQVVYGINGATAQGNTFSDSPLFENDGPLGIGVNTFAGSNDSGDHKYTVTALFPALANLQLVNGGGFGNGFFNVLPLAAFTGFQAQPLLLDFAGSAFRQTATTVLPPLSGANLSFLIGGDWSAIGTAASNGYVLACTDDGTVDANGNSLCVKSPLVANPDSSDAFVRMANVSTTPLFLCAGTTPVGAAIAPNQVSDYRKVTTNVVDTIGYSTTVTAGLCTSIVSASQARSAGDIFEFTADGSHAIASVSGQSDPRDTFDNTAYVYFVNDAAGTATFIDSNNTQYSANTQSSLSFGIAPTSTQFTVQLGADFYLFAIPASAPVGDGTLTSVIVLPLAATPGAALQVLWYSEDFTDASGAAIVTTLTGVLNN